MRRYTIGPRTQRIRAELDPATKVMLPTLRRAAGGRNNRAGADEGTRLQCWAVCTLDGRWRLVRVDAGGPTRWAVVPAEPEIADLVQVALTGCGSMRAAQEEIADGTADWELARRLREHFARVDARAAA